MKNFIVLLFFTCCATIAAAENTSRVTGVVVNEKNKPVNKAYVHVKDQLRYTHTDKSGAFELWMHEGKCELVITENGYEEYVIPVSLEKNHQLSLDTIRLKKAARNPEAHKDKNKNGRFDQLIVNVGVQQGWRTMGQVSIGICDQRFRFKKITPIWHLRQIHAGALFIIREDPIIGPKISWDATLDGWGYLSLITYGADLVYFMDSRYSGLCISPHAGLTAFAFYNVTFGYTIPLIKSEIYRLVNHFHVTLNIPLFRRITDKTLK